MRGDAGDGCGPDGTIGKAGYPLAEGHREAAARAVSDPIFGDGISPT